MSLKPAPAIAITLCLLALLLLLVRHRDSRSPLPAAARSASQAASAPDERNGAARVSSASPAGHADPKKTFPDFLLKPFPPVQTTADHGWTAEDGKNLIAIRRLAHNPLEEEKMQKENSQIFRRQLVYRHTPVTELARAATSKGQELKSITLPGFDGTEFQVDLYRTDLIDGGVEGALYGKLRNEPDSMVTVGFVGGHESFTILSLQRNFSIQGDPREAGEVILKLINPATYGGIAGEPIDPYSVGKPVPGN